MTDQQLAQKIYHSCHLQGHFTLRSGQTSTEYFDKYRFESDPQLLQAIALAAKSKIPANTQVLAAMEMGGIPIATAIALHTGLPLVFIRKQAKDYGTRQLAEGLDIKDKQLLIIEDVITTGGQVIISVEQLRRLGASIDSVLCVIDRSPHHHLLNQAHLTLHPLFTQAQLEQSL